MTYKIILILHVNDMEVGFDVYDVEQTVYVKNENYLWNTQKGMSS